jgi:hypothetical protein
MKDDIQKYIECMEEIKKRLDAITPFLERKITTGFLMTDLEFICLQYRKVLELIALSSLCANRKKYEQTRKQFHKEWKAEKILKHLEHINPTFYPTPSRQIVDPATRLVTRVEPITEGHLSRQEFLQVWVKCSNFLHAVNPYNRSAAPDPAELWNQFAEWKSRIVTLLNHHHAQLVDNRMQLWVLMQGQDGKVHVYEFHTISPFNK